MTSAAALLSAAALRRRKVEVEGEVAILVEPDVITFTEWQARLKAGDKAGALAHLLHRCVLNDDDTPVLTEAEAQQLANRSTRVAAYLAVEINRLIYDGGAEEKKA